MSSTFLLFHFTRIDASILKCFLSSVSKSVRPQLINMSKRSPSEDFRSVYGSSVCGQNGNQLLNIIEKKTKTTLCDSKYKTDVTYLPAPIKSLSDKKEYRALRLGNGLTILLISDVPTITLPLEDDDDEEKEDDESGTESDIKELSEEEGSHDSSDSATEIDKKKIHKQEEKLAAVGLCIGVGSFSDPWGIPGMAHFLEHMVFMGSEKYPKENDFDSFIKKRGGSDNAGTECEHTTFYFECQEKHLAEAMDKFAQFFISPLMKREAMTREREAIESEFQTSLPSHYNRKYQLLSSLAHPGHPATKFTWGNLKTLQENISDDDLYNAVHEFRKRHYSAHRMTLVVQARLPLDLLESWVCAFFSAVPNNGMLPDNFMPYAGSSFDTPQFRQMYRLDPIKDICQVELTWALPPLIHMYHSKPYHYIASVIGHEGKGSLLAYLRKKVWALDIYTGGNDDGCKHNSMYSLFGIMLILTDLGFKNLSKVLDAVFGYIRLFQSSGPSERIFNEFKAIEETSFRFAEEIAAADYVEMLAENMHFYPSVDYITGSRLYFEYDAEAIQKCLNALKPEDVNIMVSAKNSTAVYDKVEPWFGTKYSVSDVPAEWIESWKLQEPDPSFTLPEPNLFVSNEFNLLTHPEPVPPHPVKIQDDEITEVWYRPDVKFRLPIAYLYFNFLSPLPQSSPLNAVMLDLYVCILKQQLIEEIYPAEVAQLNTAIYACDNGIVLKVDGYSEKLHLLLETIVKHMASFEENLHENLFEAMKEEQSKYYYNSFLKPGKLAKDLRFSLILQVHWTSVDKHAAIGKVTIEKLKGFVRQFHDHLYIQSLIQGNYSKEAALNACACVTQYLKCGALLSKTLPQIRVCQVPLGQTYCCVKSYNIHDVNSVVTNYYQSGLANIKNTCLVELLMMLMDEPIFDSLRTKEQLGYHIFCKLRDTFGVIGFSITVNCQANRHSTTHVDERIEVFLKKFPKKLNKMPEKSIDGVRQSAIKLKECVDLHLKEEVSRNWDEILTMEYLFDRQEREAECIRGIKSREIRKWFNDHIASGNKSNFRKLSCQVIGHSGVQEVSNESLQQKETLMDKVIHQVAQNEAQESKPSHLHVQYGDEAEHPLQLITTSQDVKFVTNIEHFKNGLYVYPVNKILP